MADLTEKILDVLRQRRVASFATVTEDGKPWVRYVVPTADDDFRLTFPTHLKSRKVAHIRRNPEVHLTTGVTRLETARRYVQVQGTAEIRDDAEAKRAHWVPFLHNYFEGPEDPDYALVVVTPYRIEYVTMDSWSPEVWTAA
jgi:general stress protein 26